MCYNQNFIKVFGCGNAALGNLWLNRFTTKFTKIFTKNTKDKIAYFHEG